MNKWRPSAAWCLGWHNEAFELDDRERERLRRQHVAESGTPRTEIFNDDYKAGMLESIRQRGRGW